MRKADPDARLSGEERLEALSRVRGLRAVTRDPQELRALARYASSVSRSETRSELARAETTLAEAYYGPRERGEAIRDGAVAMAALSLVPLARLGDDAEYRESAKAAGEAIWRGEPDGDALRRFASLTQALRDGARE